MCSMSALYLVGECQWAGKVYKDGEGGICGDGCNSCWCSIDPATGKIGGMMTLIGCNEYYFCDLKMDFLKIKFI